MHYILYSVLYGFHQGIILFPPTWTTTRNTLGWNHHNYSSLHGELPNQHKSTTGGKLMRECHGRQHQTPCSTIRLNEPGEFWKRKPIFRKSSGNLRCCQHRKHHLWLDQHSCLKLRFGLQLPCRGHPYIKGEGGVASFQPFPHSARNSVAEGYPERLRYLHTSRF